MKRRIKNIGASVRRRLLEKAKKQGVDFNRLLLLYVQERFLYRLTHSQYRNAFVLKGGALFYAAHHLQARPTRDLDFLAGKIPSQPEAFGKVLRDVVAVEVADGVVFDADSISCQAITEGAMYEGVRAKVTAHLEAARQTLQIDAGFGDVVTPKPVHFEFPSLLDDKDFAIQAYSWESVIAEKFEAIVKLGDVNSRMKDFYDIWFLLANHEFEQEILNEAITATFKHRKTNLGDAWYIFKASFYNDPDKEKMWAAFFRKNGMIKTRSFSEIVLEIMSRLKALKG